MDKKMQMPMHPEKPMPCKTKCMPMKPMPKMPMPKESGGDHSEKHGK